MQATSEENKKRFEQSIKELEGHAGSKVVFDTNKVINKNKFNIFYFTDNNYYKVQEDDSSRIQTITFNKLTASTKYKDRRIYFAIQSNVHQKDSFYIIAMNILNSVKIE